MDKVADENLMLRNEIEDLKKCKNSTWQDLEFYKYSARTRGERTAYLTQHISMLNQQKAELAQYSQNLLKQLTSEKHQNRKLQKKVKNFVELQKELIGRRNVSNELPCSVVKNDMFCLSVSQSSPIVVEQAQELQVQPEQPRYMEVINSILSICKDSQLPEQLSLLFGPGGDDDVSDQDEEATFAYQAREKETVVLLQRLEEEAQNLIKSIEEMKQKAAKKMKEAVRPPFLKNEKVKDDKHGHLSRSHSIDNQDAKDSIPPEGMEKSVISYSLQLKERSPKPWPMLKVNDSVHSKHEDEDHVENNDNENKREENLTPIKLEISNHKPVKDTVVAAPPSPSLHLGDSLAQVTSGALNSIDAPLSLVFQQFEMEMAEEDEEEEERENEEECHLHKKSKKHHKHDHKKRKHRKHKHSDEEKIRDVVSQKTNESGLGDEGTLCTLWE